jgi:ribonucleoside-diphosphate reductase alpha chain
MKITRHYTTADKPVSKQINWKDADVLIQEKGKTIFELKGIEVPEHWSQSAIDILAHKYFRKAGVPTLTQQTHTPELPHWLSPSKPMTIGTGGETSAHQVFHRMAGHWTYSAYLSGYFTDNDLDETATETNAKSFYDELYYMLAMQIAAPNSPQWFNTGLWWAYGITSTDSESYKSDGFGFAARRVEDSYENPQTSACFILGLKDSLLKADGILDTVKKEAHIFKYGSGSGVNYSSLRAKGSGLRNGGTSSGLMSFLRLFDVNAGTIKSGGTTRRAARMAIVDCDHPEAIDFVTWKAREEVKVAAMVAGAQGTEGTTVVARRVLDTLQEAAYEGEAYNTVSGQNANNSLRVTDAFMRAIAFSKKDRVDEFSKELVKTEQLWAATIEAAWACGDPGLQFHDTINMWHTIPKVAPQRATNPCSEYSFIDNSSCNLASMNLVKFLVNGTFDAEMFEHACRLWTMVLDISVGMSSYPDKKIAENSVDYRAIGLGYANLGGLLMLLGYPYDSTEGRTTAGLVTALMHATAWRTSQEMAVDLGAFRDFETHRDDVANVLSRHKISATALSGSAFSSTIQSFEVHPLASLVHRTAKTWDKIPSLPTRNAQLTLLAPTGTIGLLMDCATTGIEPDFSLNKFKKLAGGGNLTLVNPLVDEALRTLDYNDMDRRTIRDYIAKSGRVDLYCTAIRKEHIKVFDCANDITVAGHIKMMAAVQPFLSGAISKTVNMPNSATIEDVANAYIMAWENGIKAIAIYRDGCKLSQPLTAVRTDAATNQPSPAPEVSSVGSLLSKDELAARIAAKLNSTPQLDTQRTIPGTKKHTARYKLPSRRRGFTQKVRIGNQTLYIRTGEYADGRIGEVFLNFGRDGSTMRHLLDSLAVCISLGLQHGVPLQEFVDAFSDTRAEPAGIVQGSDNVRMCSSIMDYVVRELSSEYIGKEAPAEESVDTPKTTPEANAISTENLSALDANFSRWKNDDIITRIRHKDDYKELFQQNPITTDDLELEVAAPTPGLRTLSAAAAPRYCGNGCPNCGEFTLRRSGTCHVCDSCGQTTGCS